MNKVDELETRNMLSIYVAEDVDVEHMKTVFTPKFTYKVVPFVIPDE